MENELDYLIDNLSDELYRPVGHRSRYYNYKRTLTTTYNNNGNNNKYNSYNNHDNDNNVYRTVTTTYNNTNDQRLNDHRDYIYSRYGSKSPRMPKRNTLEKGWYQNISKDMGTPRSPTPILKNRTYSPTRPSSALSRTSSTESRPQSPTYYSRPSSPRFRSMSPTRAASPRMEKSVVIGPVTEMVTRDGVKTKQEYFRSRDSQQGKPLPGRHGFMTGSWPYGLNNIEDAYLNPNKREPAASPPPSRTPPRRRTPSPPRRARSVEPPIVRTPMRPQVSAPSSPIPDYMRHLKHIVVEQIAVPAPPKYGTLTHGGRFPNVAEGPCFDGPPCELCHKPITERRCIYAENCQFHCWHFVCSFCSKTLKENDFTMAEDNKPYCLNCFKRMYP